VGIRTDRGKGYDLLVSKEVYEVPYPGNGEGKGEPEKRGEPGGFGSVRVPVPRVTGKVTFFGVPGTGDPGAPRTLPNLG